VWNFEGRGSAGQNDAVIVLRFLQIPSQRLDYGSYHKIDWSDNWEGKEKEEKAKER
jgi:hypothetical protein